MISKTCISCNTIKDIIGCSPDELRVHLENTFIKNYGRQYNELYIIHIDHIIPLCSAKTIDDINELNHYTNLQYLLSKDNLSKSCKM